ALLLLELLQRAPSGDAGLHRDRSARRACGRRAEAGCGACRRGPAADGSPLARGRRPGWHTPAGGTWRSRNVHYLVDRFQPAERRLIAIAALVLVPIFFFPVLPIWAMKLWAPQYREGLSLTIYTNAIKGDLQSINTLNHYVGMKHITAEDFKE